MLLHMWAWSRFKNIAPQPSIQQDQGIYDLGPPLGVHWVRAIHIRPKPTSLEYYREFFDSMDDSQVYNISENYIVKYCNNFL